MLCHGNGDLAVDGCCWIDGQVCPLRWLIEDGHIYEGPDLTDLGTVEGYITTNIKQKPRQDTARDMVQGARFLCRAAVEVLINDNGLVFDRPGFEAAWDAHPDYVAQVRPAWVALEQRLGLVEGEYQCSTWRGTGRAQCCFREDPVENDTKALPLSANARALREAGGV